MVTGPDGSISLKLLLLEAQPGNLEAVRTAWPQAAIVARAVGQELGVTDQISREKVQVVFCDLSGSDCPGVGVLQQIRRVHPQLPLVAVLPTRDFAMALTALRSGVDDLLVHPLSKDVLLAAGVRVSHREEFNARQAFTLQMAKRSLDDLVLLKAIGETTRSTDDLQIANQGQSVPRDSAEDIFQEYSQLGNLDVGKPRGVGGGLATCRAILRQMKSEIFLEPMEEEGPSIGLLLPSRETSMELTYD